MGLPVVRLGARSGVEGRKCELVQALTNTNLGEQQVRHDMARVRRVASSERVALLTWGGRRRFAREASTRWRGMQTALKVRSALSPIREAPQPSVEVMGLQLEFAECG